MEAAGSTSGVDSVTPDMGKVSLNDSADAVMAVLSELQTTYDGHFKEFSKERAALEKKFEARVMPLFAKRSEELAKGSLPLFWFTAFENCELIRDNMTDKDAAALRFLRDVTYTPTAVESLDKSLGLVKVPAGSYTLSFKFASNPFFHNETLTKTYIMQDEDDEDLGQAVGCKIKWKPGKNVTVLVMKKKIRGGPGGAGRVITKKEPCDSFFNFFSPPKIPEGGDLDEEDMMALEEVIGADFEIGEAIRHDIIPRAVAYFKDEVENDDSVGGGADGNESGADDENGDVENGDGVDEEGEDVGEDDGEQAEDNKEDKEDKDDQDDENVDEDEGEDEDEDDDDSKDGDGSEPRIGLPPPARSAEECKQQ